MSKTSGRGIAAGAVGFHPTDAGSTPAARSKKPLQTIVIGKLCSHKGCNLVGRYAERINDFWIVFCDEHKGKEIVLDFSKIPAAAGDPRVQ